MILLMTKLQAGRTLTTQVKPQQILKKYETLQHSNLLGFYEIDIGIL